MAYVKGPNGRVLNLPDSVASGLVAAGHVEEATKAAYTKQRKAAPVEETKETDAQAEADIPAEENATETETEGEATSPEAPGEEQPEEQGEENAGNELPADADTPPAGNASTEAWAAHALALGFAEEQIDGLGRDQIRSLVQD